MENTDGNRERSVSQRDGDGSRQRRRAVMNRREFVAGLTAATAVASSAHAQSDVVRVGYSIGQTGPLASSTPVQSQAYTLWGTQLKSPGGLESGGAGLIKVECAV